MVSSNRLLHYLRTKNGEKKLQFLQGSYLYNASSISTDSVDMMGKCVFALKKQNTIFKDKHSYSIFTSCNVTFSYTWDQIHQLLKEVLQIRYIFYYLPLYLDLKNRSKLNSLIASSFCILQIIAHGCFILRCHFTIDAYILLDLYFGNFVGVSHKPSLIYSFPR